MLDFKSALVNMLKELKKKKPVSKELKSEDNVSLNRKYQ